MPVRLNPSNDLNVRRYADRAPPDVQLQPRVIPSKRRDGRVKHKNRNHDDG